LNKNLNYMKNKTIAITIIILFVLTKILEIMGYSTDSPFTLLSLLEITMFFFIIIASVRLWKKYKLVFISFFLAWINSLVFDILLVLGKVKDGDYSLIINSIATVVYIISFIKIILKLFNSEQDKDMLIK